MLRKSEFFFQYYLSLALIYSDKSLFIKVDNQFSAEITLYNTHYTSTHILGTTGGNTDNLIEAIDLAAKGRINPAVMVTHVGGIDSIAEDKRHKGLWNTEAEKILFEHFGVKPLSEM